MKNVKKLVALLSTVVMTATIVSGCSTNGLAVFNGYSKYQTVNSMESKTDITFNVTAENLSSQEQQILTMLPAINASKISMTSKTNKNKDNTKIKSEIGLNMQFGEMPMDMGMWVDKDLTANNPVYKEIVKMPDMLSSGISAMHGKDYLVMDIANMKNTTDGTEFDVKKLDQLSRELQPKIINFMNQYANNYNNGTNVINKLDSKDIVVAGKTQHVNIYELKLDDKSFKDILRYTVKNFGDNKDMILAFVKDIMTYMAAITPSSSVEADKMDILIKNMDAQLLEAVKQLNSGLDSLDGITLLGNSGIDIKFAINDEGYIVNENGSIQLKSSMEDIKKLTGEKSLEGYTGIYNATINFNTDIYNINGDVSIAIPETNSSNSVDYMELIKAFTPVDDIDTTYKKAYDDVEKVVALAKANKVKPYFYKTADSLDQGISDINAVADAADQGLQQYINIARDSISKLPDSLQESKNTFSSILDNYQHVIYERTVFIINSNKTSPKQSDVIVARRIIKSVKSQYRSTYSSALDEIQNNLFINAKQLVDKAVSTKNQTDIDNAKQAIADLKTIPSEFSSTDIMNFIQVLESQLK